MKRFLTRGVHLLLVLVLLISTFSVGIVPVAATEETKSGNDGVIAPAADSNATYAPESAHIWSNKELKEGDELGEYQLNLDVWVNGTNLILEENVPLDVVFCIDQSASMYKPAYAQKDLHCNDSFGTSRNKESTAADKAATGEISRAEFINGIKNDPEFRERATHYGYFIGRIAGPNIDKTGRWFILRYDESSGEFRGYKSCRTNHPTSTTYSCPDTSTSGNHGNSGYFHFTIADMPAGLTRFYITQYGMMYEAVQQFVEAARENSLQTGMNHRFAFTTFSGISGDNEKGTSVIIGNQRTTYEYIYSLPDESYHDAFYANALMSVQTEEGWNKVLQSVDTIKSDYGGTHTQAGIRLAKEVLNHTKNDPLCVGRKRFVLLFTDGEPNMYFLSQGETAPSSEAEKIRLAKSKAISESFTIKKSATVAENPGLGAQIYTVCTTGDSDGDFLRYISSTYPTAVSLDDVRTPVDRVYYFLEKNAANLTSIFAEIRDKEFLDRSALGTDLILRDVISSDFEISAANAIAYKVPYTGNDTFATDESQWINITDQVTISIQQDVEEYGGNDLIEVTGFDYAGNHITDSPSVSGYKLLVRFEINAKDMWAGKKAIATNEPPSGVYGEEGKIIGFAGPTVDVPTKIYLKKTVEGEQANTNDEFDFTVTSQKQVRNASGFFYTIIRRTENTDGLNSVMVARGGHYLQANVEETTETVSLKHEGVEEIGPLEPGSTITLREHTKPGYTATIKIEYADGTQTLVTPDANGNITVAIVPGMTIHYVNFAYPRPDTVVMDYGLSMDVNVLLNDMICSDGELVAVGAELADLAPTKSLNSNFKSSYKAKFGTVSVNGSKVTYKPSSMRMNETDVISYAVKKVVDNVTYYFYSTLTVVPATSIYYEDSFITFSDSTYWKSAGTTKTLTQGEDRPGQYEYEDYDANNPYGFDSAYDSSTTYSYGSAKMAHVDASTYASNGNKWPTATFTFTGTGFDLISLTSNKTGFITCDVYTGTSATSSAKKYSWVVDSYYGYTRERDTQYPWIEYCHTYNKSQKRWTTTETAVAEKTHTEATQLPSNPSNGKKVYQYKENYIWTANTSGSNALYQIPVIRYTDLDYGTYTIVVTPTYIPLFDHNPTVSGYDFYLDAVRVYNPAQNMESYYLQDNEAYPQYVELRKQLITTDSNGNATGYVNGITYVDGVESNGVMTDYETIGPNNEIYLNPNRAIAFAIDTNGGKIADVQVGMKTFGTSASLKASAVSSDGKTLATKTLSSGSHTDRYYSIKTAYVPVSGSEVSNVIVLTNTGSTPITLTTLKITYEEEPAQEAALVMDTAHMQAAKRHVSFSILPAEVETSVEDTLVFLQHSLSLQSNISMDFLVDSAVLADFDSYYVEFERYDHDKDTMVYETVEGREFAGQMIFSYGLDSYQMTDVLSATLCAVQDGVVYRGETITDSIEQYVISRLPVTEDEKLLTLYVNLLTYGAKAQIYMEYRTDALADANLGAYAAYVTTADPEADHYEAITSYSYSGSELISIALGISSEIQLQMLVTLNGYDAENVYGELRFQRNGETVTQRIEGAEFTACGDYYLMIFDCLTAVDGRTPVEVTVYTAEGEPISETWTYSISAYYNIRNSGTAGDTMKALLNYLDAAAAYFET